MFALGATLYSLLTGRPPFQAASVIETLDLVRTREPAPPRTLVPGLPRDLETIALTCLRKDPRRRYASAEALADDLERWLDGFPIRRVPVSKLEHASRWCRRRPAFASLLAVLALTVASSLVGLLTLWRHSEAERGGPRMPWPVPSRATKPRPERFAISSACWQRPWMHRKCSRLNGSTNLRASYAISRRSCARIEGIAASNLVAICDLERQLADDFRRRGKLRRIKRVAHGQPGVVGGAKTAADDPDVDEAYARALMELGWIARDQERYDEMLVFFQRAEAVLEGLAHDPRKLDVILSIDESRRAIAWLLGRRGLEEPRRRLLESHIRMLEQLSEHAGGEPAIGLLAALARSDLALDRSARARSSAPRSSDFAANRRLSERFEWKVADWIAEDIQPVSARREFHRRTGGPPRPGRPRPCGHPGDRIKM